MNVKHKEIVAAIDRMKYQQVNMMPKDGSLFEFYETHKSVPELHRYLLESYWLNCSEKFILALKEYLGDGNYKRCADMIILLHWLCYIMDRQMPVRIIWNVGGYVISDLVCDFVKGRVSCSKLLKKDIKYYKYYKNKPEKKYNSAQSNVDLEEEPTARYSFFSESAPNDLIVKSFKQYIIKKEENDSSCVRFSSRFYTVDYQCIVFTLLELEKKENDFSIISYFARIIQNIDPSENETKEYIDAIAEGLYRLSFNGSSTQMTDDFSIIDDKYNSRELSEQGVFKGNDYRFGSSKRIWCAMRDYLKCVPYRIVFEKAIMQALDENSEVYMSFWKHVLKSPDDKYRFDALGCRYIELPGDVWNENSMFRRCFDPKQQSPKGKFGKHARAKNANCEAL